MDAVRWASALAARELLSNASAAMRAAYARARFRERREAEFAVRVESTERLVITGAPAEVGGDQALEPVDITRVDRRDGVAKLRVARRAAKK